MHQIDANRLLGITDKRLEFNAQFAASANQAKKEVNTNTIDQHFSKTLSSSSPIKTQDQLDNEIMVRLFVTSEF